VTDPVPVSPQTPSEERSTRRYLIAALRRALERADLGTLAALRRPNSGSPPAAFYRITVGILDEILPETGARRDQDEARWATVVSAMAAAQGFLARVPLGEALAKADVAEMRVVRLLEANADQLIELTRNIVRQLVQKGQPFDPDDLADLVLSAGTPSEKTSRRFIAREFYRHVGE
jgi:CRISPR type I-E-associated protein CasB/Cse2